MVLFTALHSMSCKRWAVILSWLKLAFIKGNRNCGGYGVEAFSIAIKARLDKFFNAGETKFEGDCL